MTEHRLIGHGLIIIEASWSHSDTTLCSTPLEEWSARHKELYWTAHEILNNTESHALAGWAAADPQAVTGNASEHPILTIWRLTATLVVVPHR